MRECSIDDEDPEGGSQWASDLPKDDGEPLPELSVTLPAQATRLPPSLHNAGSRRSMNASVDRCAGSPQEAPKYDKSKSWLAEVSTEDPEVGPALTRKSRRNGSSQLSSKIMDFGSQREQEKLRMFAAVMWVFLRLLAFGASISAIGALARTFLPETDLTVAISGVVLNIGFTSCIGSLVIGSACPFDLLDVNKMFRKSRKFAFSFFGACGLISLAQAAYFPHLELLKVLLSVAACMGSCRRLEARWPTATTWCVLWIVIDRMSWGAIYLAPEENLLVGTLNPVSYSLGAFNLLTALVMLGVWLRKAGRGEKGASLGMYRAFYAWCLILGLTNVVTGVSLGVEPRPDSSDRTRAVVESTRGLCVLTPAMLVLLLGRDNLFHCLGKRFDRDGARLQRDGAFIAELLEAVPVHAGQLWWVHKDLVDENFQECDPRRNWQQGLVTEVSEDLAEFVVRLPEFPTEYQPVSRMASMKSSGGRKLSKDSVATLRNAAYRGGLEVRLPLPGSQGAKSKEALLLQAQDGLRCVDFENLYPELMMRVDAHNNPELKASWHNLSRPLRPGETIDYFFSNSWYDDPERKWEKLKEVADVFRRQHGRYPTFWIDKLCIDQEAITDGLKVLPVVVMACRKLLVMCGPTYPTRLWCIWELFTLFAFINEATAQEHIKFVFLADHEEGVAILDGMSRFNVKDAHCYNPNDEERLREVIEAVGTEQFNTRISNMATAVRTRLEQEHRNRMLAVGRTTSTKSGGSKSPRVGKTLSTVSASSLRSPRSPRSPRSVATTPNASGPAGLVV